MKNWPATLSLVTRGPATVMTVLGTLALFIDFSRFPAVRAIHALIVGWNQIMGRLAGLIPFELPFEVGALEMNVVVLWLVLVMPVLKIISYATGATVLGEIAFVFTFSLMYFGLTLIVLPGIEDQKPWAHVFSLLTTGLYSLWFMLFLFSALSESQRFRLGFIYAISALAMIEILYFSPVVGDWLDAFADSILGPV